MSSPLESTRITFMDFIDYEEVKDEDTDDENIILLDKARKIIYED